MRFDHVAVVARNIAESVDWYTSRFGARILYQDASWAFLQFGGTKLALVSPNQHPPHVAVSVTAEELTELAQNNAVKIDAHRDGTRGIYINDPSGNAVEFISYPPGETAYAGAKAAAPAKDA